MKRLLYIFFIASLLFLPLQSGAVTGEDVRWDWSLGEPSITDDPTSACDDTAVARFDWVLGEPSVVFDATANCEAVAPAPSGIINRQDIIWFD